MPITYPITLPAEFKSARITLTGEAAVATTKSPFNFSTQKQVHQGQAWLATIELAKMKRAKAEVVIASLLQMNGPEGNCYLGDTANKLPRGTVPGVPLVAAGNVARSNDLLTKGWTPSQNGILLCGDWVQIFTNSSRKLHKVLADVNSDGSGNATLLLWPKTRSAYANNSAIVTTNPTGVFSLVESSTWDIDLVKVYGITVTFEELLP